MRVSGSGILVTGDWFDVSPVEGSNAFVSNAFGVWVRVSSLGFRVPGSGIRVQGRGSGIRGSGVRGFVLRGWGFKRGDLISQNTFINQF